MLTEIFNLVMVKHSLVMLLVYVIVWVAVVSGINCTSNAGWKLVIAQSRC